MNKTLRLIITIAFTAISSFSFAQKQVVISPEELQGPTAGKDISINKDGITITISYGAMNNKFSYRLYQKATMTITSANYNMTNIIIECDTHESGERDILPMGLLIIWKESLFLVIKLPLHGLVMQKQLLSLQQRNKYALKSSP